MVHCFTFTQFSEDEASGCFKGHCEGVFPFLFEIQVKFLKKTRSLLTNEKNAGEQMGSHIFPALVRLQLSEKSRRKRRTALFSLIPSAPAPSYISVQVAFQVRSLI